MNDRANNGDQPRSGNVTSEDAFRLASFDERNELRRHRKVPAMQLYRYASVLRSLTGGRGLHSEEFTRYEEMPRELEANVIEAAKRVRAGNGQG